MEIPSFLWKKTLNWGSKVASKSICMWLKKVKDADVEHCFRSLALADLSHRSQNPGP